MSTEDNLLDQSTESPQDEDTTPVLQKFDSDELYGYECAQVVEQNTLTEIPLDFFVDLSFPTNEQTAAIAHVQAQLIDAIAEEYGLLTGTRCSDPPFDQSSWLVHVESQTKGWVKDTDLDSCKEMTVDTTTHECFVFQATVLGSVLSGDMSDVLTYIGTAVSAASITAGTDYGVQFLGVPESDGSGGDSGRDNLDDPNGLNGGDKEIPHDDGRDTITIVGGMLVAAFCLAFIGVGFVLYRRRQQWIDKQDAIGKSDSHIAYDTEEVPTKSSDEDGHHEIQARTPQYRDTQEEVFPNNITFDLGTSFKDQLMGVHGAGSGQRPRPPNHGVLGAHPGGPLYATGSRPLSDGASEASDADSWAQTDGTIGSLELQLEPITAEV